MTVEELCKAVFECDLLMTKYHASDPHLLNQQSAEYNNRTALQIAVGPLPLINSSNPQHVEHLTRVRAVIARILLLSGAEVGSAVIQDTNSEMRTLLKGWHNISRSFTTRLRAERSTIMAQTFFLLALVVEGDAPDELPPAEAWLLYEHPELGSWEDYSRSLEEKDAMEELEDGRMDENGTQEPQKPEENDAPDVHGLDDKMDDNRVEENLPLSQDVQTKPEPEPDTFSTPETPPLEHQVALVPSQPRRPALSSLTTHEMPRNTSPIPASNSYYSNPSTTFYDDVDEFPHHLLMTHVPAKSSVESIGSFVRKRIRDPSSLCEVIVNRQRKRSAYLLFRDSKARDHAYGLLDRAIYEESFVLTVERYRRSLHAGLPFPVNRIYPPPPSYERRSRSRSRSRSCPCSTSNRSQLAHPLSSSITRRTRSRSRSRSPSRLRTRSRSRSHNRSTSKHRHSKRRRSRSRSRSPPPSSSKKHRSRKRRRARSRSRSRSPTRGPHESHQNQSGFPSHSPPRPLLQWGRLPSPVAKMEEIPTSPIIQDGTMQMFVKLGYLLAERAKQLLSCPSPFKDDLKKEEQFRIWLKAQSGQSRELQGSFEKELRKFNDKNLDWMEIAKIALGENKLNGAE